MKPTQDQLSKIDFTQCKLEPLGDVPLKVIGDTISVSIRSAETGTVILRKALDGDWQTRNGATHMTRSELDRMFERCDPVDRFIVAELKKQSEPDWAPIKNSEVQRLDLAGAHVQYRFSWTPADSPWRERNSPGRPAFEGTEYRIDLKTVPAGVSLYEPSWIDVLHTEVRRLLDAGATVRAVRENLTCPGLEYAIVFDPNNVAVKGPRYQVDKKTVSAGVKLYEPNWTDVRWTEVERLARLSVDMQASDTGANGPWWSGDHLCGVDATETKYRVDAKTVPDGVALYEPDWTPIHWTDADVLVKAGATVEMDIKNTPRFGWARKPTGAGACSTMQYRVDAKTVPDGFTLKTTGEEAVKKAYTGRVVTVEIDQPAALDVHRVDVTVSFDLPRKRVIELLDQYKMQGDVELVFK